MKQSWSFLLHWVQIDPQVLLLEKKRFAGEAPNLVGLNWMMKLFGLVDSW
jgi:hypothetical protein